MPDVHVPQLDDQDEEPTAPVPTPVSTSHHRRKSFVTIALEVVLALKQDLTTLFASDAPMTSARIGETVHMTMGVGPVFFEQAAWDLALATQALAHIDADLAFRLSRVYTVQQEYAGLQRAIVQSTITFRQENQGILENNIAIYRKQ